MLHFFNQNKHTAKRTGATWWMAVAAGLWWIGIAIIPGHCWGDPGSDAWPSVALDDQRIDRVAPWTGIVLWNDHDQAATEAIALEFAYVGYDDCYQGETLDFSAIDALLDDIASRGHQAILRFHFVYPGKESRMPGFIKARPDYEDRHAKSEGKRTGFVDWSCKAITPWLRTFYSRFAQRYDRDPRLAYLQTGFGLWAEYHIYDGPRQLGRDFPSHEDQANFLTHLGETFRHTPWAISVDAADDEYSPIIARPDLMRLRFGVFDDSFLCKTHAKENEINWNDLSRSRIRVAPAGGEFSYYSRRDQKLALAPNGPHGESFESAAKRFGLTYIIGNDQPEFQNLERIAQAGMATGYRMRISARKSDGKQTAVTLTNQGIAPMYHDAYVAVGQVRAVDSLRGLMPGQTKTYLVDAAQGPLSLASDRLLPGMTIPFETGR